MYSLDFQIVKCGKCESTNIEHVTYNNQQFKRCRKCGHESTKTSLIPEMSSDKTSYQLDTSKPITF